MGRVPRARSGRRQVRPERLRLARQYVDDAQDLLAADRLASRERTSV
jgi:hypothetical protein